MRFKMTVVFGVLLVIGLTCFATSVSAKPPQPKVIHEGWTSFTKVYGIIDIAFEGDYIWCATLGGVVQFDTTDDSYVKYTSEHGLANTNVYSIAIDSNGVKWFGTWGGVSRFDDRTSTFVESNELQREFTLGNYPNPFNPTTTITYTLTEPGPVTLSIYNPAGQLVEKLVNELKSAGNHAVTWKPENLSSGVYLYRLENNGFHSSGKMMLIK